MPIEQLRYIVTANTAGFSGPMKAIGALAVTAFIAAIKVTAEFEKQMSKLRAVSGATEEQMSALERNARGLGKTTAFTATQVAGLQVELAKLGFTSSEILNSSGGVLDLAAGLGVSLADAAVLTGSTIRSFGLEATDTRKVVDILAKAASESALDFGKMTESLKLAAPVARAANVSLEETVGILEVLANNGIHGSMAGTGLAKVFVEVAKSGIPLNELLLQISNSEDQLSTATELFGLRANKVALIMANNLTPAVRDFNGVAKEQREIMEDNLIGDFKELVSAVTELGIQAGKSADGGLRKLTQRLQEIVTYVNTRLEFNTLLDQINASVGDSTLAVKEFDTTIRDVLRGSLNEKGSELLNQLEIIEAGLSDLDPDYAITGKGLDALSKFFKQFDVDISNTKGDIREIQALLKTIEPNILGNVKVTGAEDVVPADIDEFSKMEEGLDASLTTISSKFKELTELQRNAFAELEGGQLTSAEKSQQWAGAIIGAFESASTQGGNFLDNLARGLLSSLGSLLIQKGTAAIFSGIADNAIIPGSGTDAINKGILVAAAGVALKSGSSIGRNSGGGSGGSGGGSSSSGNGSSVSGLSPVPTSTRANGKGMETISKVRGNTQVHFLQVATNRRNAQTGSSFRFGSN